MAKKIIIVDADYVPGSYQDELEPKVKVFDKIDKSLIEELVGELNSDVLQAIFDNPILAQNIADMGYVNVEEIKDLEEKVILEQKFYMTSHGLGLLQKVNLNKLNNYQARDLACPGSGLYQLVDVDATLKNFPQAYLAYRKAKIAENKKIKAREEAKKKRADKVLEKKIAKAKELLATVEEINP